MRGPGIALFALLLFVCGWSSASADFDAGLRAFEAKDYKTAFSEWRAAADEGDAKSQFRLGKLYEEGRGVPQNYVQAHLYYNLAAAEGSDEARAARDAVSGKMVKEELAEARKLATAWEPGERGQAGGASQRATQAEQEDPFALFQAADTGDAKRVEELLAGGTNAGIADAEGQTPLMFAAGNGHVDIVNLLLRAGADPDTAAEDGTTALLASTLGNHPGVIETLVEAGANPNAANSEGLTPLLAALFSKHPEAANALIDGGAEVDARLDDGTTALMLAIISDQKDTAQALLEMGADVNAANEEGVTALMAATRIGDASLISDLLDRGADAAHKNAAGQTALEIAEQQKDSKTAEQLLSEMPGQLMETVNRGYVEAAQRQIAKGADVNESTGDGWSPILLASAKGNLQIALLLIAAEADVNHANKDGLTALMAAALGGHTDIVKALIDAGANPGARNTAGLTARDIAKEKGNDEVAALLGPSKEQNAEVQRLLAQLGYDPGSADGVIGPRTTRAIKTYQKHSKLSEDGEVTQRLMASLNEAYREKEKAAWADTKSRNSIEKYQAFLKNYPRSKRITDAHKQIAVLKEEQEQQRRTEEEKLGSKEKERKRIEELSRSGQRDELWLFAWEKASGRIDNELWQAFAKGFDTILKSDIQASQQHFDSLSRYFGHYSGDLDPEYCDLRKYLFRELSKGGPENNSRALDTLSSNQLVFWIEDNVFFIRRLREESGWLGPILRRYETTLTFNKSGSSFSGTIVELDPRFEPDFVMIFPLQTYAKWFFYEDGGRKKIFGHVKDGSGQVFSFCS